MVRDCGDLGANHSAGAELLRGVAGISSAAEVKLAPFFADSFTMPDYIPERDGSFGLWLDNLASYVGEHAEVLPLSSQQIADLQAAAEAFGNSYANHLDAHRKAIAARAGKDQSRQNAQALARQLVRMMQADPTLSDTQRAAMAITIPDHRRAIVTPPSDPPVINVQVDNPLRHCLLIQAKSSLHSRRPADSAGCEIWRATIEENGKTGEWRFVALATRAAHTVTLPPDLATRRVTYKGRWYSARGNTGPFGPPSPITIAA